MIGFMLPLMKALNHWIYLKKAIAKIRKRATFLKQPLDSKLFLRYYAFNKAIFIANNACIYITHVIFLLFMLLL